MRFSSTVIALAALAVGSLGVASAQRASDSALKKITPAGVAGIKLGASYEALRARGLIGGIRHGCELGGPETRSAPLRRPLRGNVDFTLKDPRKVRTITVRKGAAARGVGIGATIEQIEAAYPAAKVDHSTDGTFLVTLVRIPKDGGGKIMFAVSTMTKRVTLIGVPSIAFCE